MRRYLARRVGQAVFVLWAAYTVSFLVLFALPSDPVAIMAGAPTDLTPEQMGALRHSLGFDRPLVTQYFSQLGHVVRGDLGRSVQSRRRVVELIADALPSTLQIAAAALLLAVIVGGGIAILATFLRKRWLRQALLGLPPLGVAIPSFWLGLLLLQRFSFDWKWFPATGNSGWKSVVLPAITLGVSTGALIAQVLAKSLRNTLREAYIDTAKSKGARPIRVHLRHALRNASLPALTMAGLIVGQLFAGSVVTETVFSRSGIGRVTTGAVGAQDIPVVQGLVLFGAVIFVTINLIVDLVYPLLDPRIVSVRARRASASVTGAAAPVAGAPA